MKLSIGLNVPIHSYKHNKKLHRVWRKAVVLYKDEQVVVTANNRTKVIENDGRSWFTREPAICYFYSEYWFNIIGMLKPDGVYFYCNMSSPYLYDGEAIKYIDYDLDIKVFPDGKYVILDEKEYAHHQDTMCYPEEIQEILFSQMEVLKKKIENKEKPFDLSDIHRYHEFYKKMIKR